MLGFPFSRASALALICIFGVGACDPCDPCDKPTPKASKNLAVQVSPDAAGSLLDPAG